MSEDDVGPVTSASSGVLAETRDRPAATPHASAQRPDGIWALPLLRSLASSRFRVLLALMLVAFGGFIHWLDHRLVAPQLHGVAPDLGVYYAAAERMLAGSSPYLPEQLTGPVDAVCTGCYLYPPVWAQFLAPLTLAPPATASAVWWVLQVVAAFTAVWLATGLGGARSSVERVAWCLVAVLWFAPLYDSMRLGNVTSILALGATLVALGGSVAGVGAALGSLVKAAPATLVPAVLVMGAASRRALVVTIAVVLTASVVIAPQAWLDYGRVIPNLLAGSADYSWNFAPANIVSQAGLDETIQLLVRLGTLLLAGVALVGSVLLARRPKGVPAAAFLGVLAMLLLPGVLWFHYVGVILPFAAIVWPSASYWTRAALVMSAVIMVPYLFVPLAAVAGAAVMVAIVGSSLLRRSLGGDAPMWSPGRAGAQLGQA